MHHGLRGGWTPPCGTGHFWPALYLQMRRPVYARPISSLPHSVNSCVRSSVKSLFKVPAGPYYYTCTQSGFHAPPAEKQRRQAVEYYNIEAGLLIAVAPRYRYCSGATFTVAVAPLLLAESSGDSSAATFLAPFLSLFSTSTFKKKN